MDVDRWGHEITLSIPVWIGGSAIESYDGWNEFSEAYPKQFLKDFEEFHMNLYEARDDMELSPVKIDRQFIENNSGLFYDKKNDNFALIQQFPDDNDAIIIGWTEGEEEPVYDSQPFSSGIWDAVGFDFGEKAEVYMVLSLMMTAPLLNWLKPKVLESILEV